MIRKFLILLFLLPVLVLGQQIKPISGVPHEIREAGNITFVTQLHYNGPERIFPVSGQTVVYKGELSYADVLVSGVVGGYWNEAYYEDGTEFDNGKILICLDDGYADNYTVAYPLFVEKGIPATFWIKTSFIGGVDAMTWDNLVTMNNAGMDIQCHTQNYGVMTNDTKANIITDLEAAEDDFTNNGLPAPQHIAYPGGYFNDSVVDAVNDLRLTGRGILSDNVNRKSGLYTLPSPSITVQPYRIEDDLDEIKANKTARILYGHRVGETTTGLFVSVDSLEKIIDYGLSIGLDFITFSDLYDLMFYMDIYSATIGDDRIDIYTNNKLTEQDSISLERSDDGGDTYSEIAKLSYDNSGYSDTSLDTNTVYCYRARGFRGNDSLPFSREEITSTELTYTLTATGTGSGVAKLEWRAGEAVTLSVTGDARFYTDAAGTENESTSVTNNLPTNNLSTNTYIRLASGTAQLKVSRNSIIRINGYTAATNAPSLSGDIGLLRALDLIHIAGLNSVSGDITKLTDLTYIKVEGSNTISGSVADLINLTYLYVKGDNTISGSLTNLVNLETIYVLGDNELSGSITDIAGLTAITLYGANTVSGSITGKPLTTINVGGNNTLSGDVSTLTNLTYLYCKGNNSLSGSIEDLDDLTYIDVQGSNSRITGDLGLKSNLSSMTRITLYDCAITDYTSGATWPDARVVINPAEGYGLSSTEVDNILIDMANSSPGPTGEAITLMGSNAPRTSNSDDAVTTLEDAGCTVTTNSE